MSPSRRNETLVALHRRVPFAVLLLVAGSIGLILDAIEAAIES